MKKETTKPANRHSQRTIRSAFMLAVSLACLCGLPFAGAMDDPGKASTADVKGITLGMTLEQVQKVFPRCYLYDDLGGRGWRQGEGDHSGIHTNWSVTFDLFDKPYGTGVTSVVYKKEYINIDRVTVQKTIKKELVAKYGEPTFNDAATNGSFHAYWGKKCDMTNYIADISDPNKSGYELDFALKHLLPDGPYIVAICGNMSTQYGSGVYSGGGLFLEVIMFDLTPYHAQMKEQERKKQEQIKSNSTQGTGL